MSNITEFSPPYGPAANAITVLNKWRDHSIPEQVTKEWLSKIGLSPNLAATNIRGLQFLGLIDDSGFPTELAQAIRTAPSDQYQSVLSAIIRKAYALIFEVLDPATASRTQIDDAFRHEKPEAQRSRMVAFFLGLCREAGIAVKEPAQGGRPPKKTATGGGRPRPAAEPYPKVLALPPAAVRALDPALVGIIGKISDLETADELEAWIAMFRAAFSFVKKIPLKQ
jgi:hypothetical protein